MSRRLLDHQGSADGTNGKRARTTDNGLSERTFTATQWHTLQQAASIFGMPLGTLLNSLPPTSQSLNDQAGGTANGIHETTMPSTHQTQSIWNMNRAPNTDASPPPVSPSSSTTRHTLMSHANRDNTATLPALSNGGFNGSSLASTMVGTGASSHYVQAFEPTPSNCRSLGEFLGDLPQSTTQNTPLSNLSDLGTFYEFDPYFDFAQAGSRSINGDTFAQSSGPSISPISPVHDASRNSLSTAVSGGRSSMSMGHTQSASSTRDTSLDQQSPRLDISPNNINEHVPSSEKVPRRRGPFKNEQERKQTKLTRQQGACLRCRKQKKRCIPDEDNPSGLCQCCKAVMETALTPPICMRNQVTDAKLFEKGKHPQSRWSTRWERMAFVEIKDWVSAEVKTIRITQDVNNLSYELPVREFVPKPGDSMEREWYTNEVRHNYRCTNFAIENMADAGRRLVKFVDDSIEASIDHYIPKSDWLLRHTYMAAVEASTKAEHEDERTLLRSLLKLWVSVRMESRSERICSDETLGMPKQTWDPQASTYGQVLVPPVMSAQIELIATVSVLLPMRKAVLSSLRKLIEKNRTRSWFTIYLCLFILLHSCALLTDFENRQAKKYGMVTRYVYKPLVQELHLGSNILLSYFHHCTKGNIPLTMDWQSSRDVELAELRPEQVAFVEESVKHVKAKAAHFKHIRDKKMYEDPYFFLSQLYDSDWVSLPTI